MNYLRHQVTKYDYHLDQVHGKVRIDDAYLAIREKVFEAIAKTYPWLADECRRQENGNQLRIF